MTDFIRAAMVERKLGLALHYPLLHAAVVGLAAKHTFEFGAGGSTRVFVEALSNGSKHTSVSTEDRVEVAEKSGILLEWSGWTHLRGRSEEHRDYLGTYDIVLHDGSHAANVVAADVAWIWPMIRGFGLLLVHDTQHSYVGAEVREGLRSGLAQARARFSATTLSYGFGLTIVRREDGLPVVPARAKENALGETSLTTVRF